MITPKSLPRRARRPWRPVLVLAGVVLLGAPLAAAVSPPSLGPDHQVRLLSAPSGADPLDIAGDYLAANAAALGLTAADVAALALEHQYRSDTLGTNIFYLQRVGAIPVFNAITSVHVLDSGAILAVNNRAIGELSSKVSTTIPLLTAASAYTQALGYVGKSGAIAVPLMPLDPVRQGMAFTGVGATKRPVPVQLLYVQRNDGAVRLAWEVYAMTSRDEVWYLHVDAVDGSLLGKHNLVNNLHKFRVYPFDSESPISTESPTDLGHQLVSEFGDLEASPLGWITGSSTTGNNVVAVEDRDDDVATSGYQPAGVGVPGSLVFDFAHDDSRNPCEQPTPLVTVASNPANLKPCDPYDPLDHNTNLDAAIVNLFYWNNVMHDVMWHYGFTEAAGNFQQTNFTTEGTWRDVDPVLAEAQDGSGTNNANFFTPPDDGVTPLLLPPQMQMYEWSPPGALRVNEPAGFEDFDDGDNSLSAATASFGVSLADLAEADRTGDVELGDDGSTGDGTGTVNDGCEPLVGFTPGKIALVERGLCEFGVKVLNGENAGAKAVVIANTLGREVGTPMGPGAVGAQVTIPSLMIGDSNGDRLRDALNGGPVNVTLQILPVPNRDSDLDAGVIAHEYGHGISNRLIGGPTSIACLINAQQPDPNSPGALIPIGEQMGEGWSDLYAMILTAQPSDTGNTPRGVGAYISYQDEDGPGIRRFPYSRNLAVNPYTYGDVATETAPHGVGSVWATMVWDMYWNLVDAHGFEPDLFDHTSDAGNVRALHYINDGIVVTKCRPSFVDARNGILTAEAADGDTEDACLIWQAFARRGLGVAALNPTLGEDHRQVLEDFTVPPTCASAGNLAPEAQADAYSTKRNTALKVAAPGVLANDADPDGQPITARLIAGPSKAKSFTLRPDGSFDYVPSNGFTGSDSFTYVAQDGEVSSPEATVTIEVRKK
jgi:extracellular elastinolytic metalloproteinase